ncbi:Helix-turn-helix domain-containing protein [Lachnospiraceae bacterium YSD2013]|jgi:YesN/AraC family two-component response regulator|nr:response regulator [Lachnospiraceae bacterium]SCX02565.1 Helix-turn-helix domain-containing protein [Lachnospiraceae bacterium YSD2013]
MLNVYIADDEVWITLGLKKLLEKLNMDVFVVGTANNGLTAKEEIAMFKPDVVFTDIRMPGLSGLELLQAIPEVSPDTKVVIISGYAEFSYAKEAVQHHAYDYLLKPIKEEDLQRVLSAIVNETGVEASEEGKTVYYDRLIDNVVTEIRDHYMEDISLTSLAGKYNVSMGRLSEMIKEHLKVNFSDYIATLRIQRAKELLRDESLSIQEIAEIVGYNDYFYFTKVFKKVAGISPSKYRKSI